MINLFDKSRSPFPKDEILTQSFLINKIADEMKMKYKKVFSVINYDEVSLKNDIHILLSKYISNKKKEINIKYIETTILNKVREKYKAKKRALNPINIKKQKQKSLIKIIYSTPTNPNNINSYLNINKKNKTISATKNAKNNKNNLSPIKPSTIKKNDSAENINVNQDKSENNISNNIIEVNENENVNDNENSEGKMEKNNFINDKNNIKLIEEINNDEDMIKKNIHDEQEEIKVLEKYKEEIQNEINDIDKVIEKQDKIKNLKNNLINDNNYEYNNVQQSSNERYNLNNNNNYNYNNDYNENKNEDEDNFMYPKMTREQKQYLEIKKRIEEDFYNKQNRYIFLKPKKYNPLEEENNLNNANNNRKNIYEYDNYRINKYSVDKLNEYYKIKEKIKQEKERQLHNNKSARNIYKLNQIEENKIINRKKPEINNMPYEDKIQLKILQRSLDQQRAIEHLRNILYPQKQLLAESEYQGFDSNQIEKNELKQKEYELADKARKIQIEKMKKLLDSSIDDKKLKKLQEKEIEKKYRVLLDKEHEIFLQKEKQKKNEQATKIENYRKMLDEQIQAKKQIMLEENNLSEINKELISIE
jgi:hypothetical protein